MRKPQMMVFAGVNGAGKSTLTRCLAGRLSEGEFAVIDPDAVAREMSPSDPEKAVFAAGREALRLVDAAIASGRNFTVETTLSGGNALRQMRKAREAGFHVTLFYIALASPELNIERVRLRVRLGGHFIPEETIRRRFTTSFENLPEAMHLAHDVFLLDNTESYVKLVEIRQGRVVFQEPDPPAWAGKALLEWNPEFEPITRKTQSGHCYRGTHVLINHADLKDQEALDRFESAAVSFRIAELYGMGVTGRLDFEHLQAIHRHIFQDVYPFAGEIRQVDISKGFPFARFPFIVPEGRRLMRELAAENRLAGLDMERFAGRAAHYMAELNVLHPFREGNGRSLREFMRQLALNAGYDLDFTLVSARKVFEASVASTADPEPLAQVLRECLHPQKKAGQNADS